MDNEMRGAFFINDKKEKEGQKDYSGHVTIHGVKYWLSGWKKVAKSGVNYVSLSVQESENKAALELASEIKDLAEKAGREWGAFKGYLQGKYTDCKGLSEAIQKHEKEIREELKPKPEGDPLPWEEGNYPPDWDTQ